jgi:hypothetical protein
MPPQLLGIPAAKCRRPRRSQVSKLAGDSDDVLSLGQADFSCDP